MIRELFFPNQIMWCIVLIMVVLAGVSTPDVRAGEGRSMIALLHPQPSYVKTLDFPCCPDYYCRKPIPCVTAATSFCTNSFRSKAFICLPCPACKFYQNEYCSKEIPKKCLLNTNRWLKCVSQAHKHCSQATTSQRNTQRESRRQK